MGEDFNENHWIQFLRSKRGAIATSLIGIVILGTTVYRLTTLQNYSETVTPLSEQTPAIAAISALGRIEPQGEVIQLSPPPNQGGSKVLELLVKEGEAIAPNQIVAILENRDRLFASIETAKTGVKVAQANLEVIKAGAKAGEIAAQEATIQRLEAQLQGEKQTQSAKIDRLTAELRNGEAEYERYQFLAENGAISQSLLDARLLTLQTAREQLIEAKAFQIQTINTLEKRLLEARATLDKIAEVRPVDLQKAQAEVENAIATLKKAEADLELAYVRSPISGQVLKINTYPGETIAEGNGILDIGKTTEMVVIAEVYESEINQVRLGQTATIRSETGAFNGELEGEVSQIGLQIGKKDVLDTDPAADVDSRVVEVEILLNPEDSDRVSNLTYSKVIVKILL